MVERVSTFGLGQSLLRSSMTVQSNYATASSQKASGLVTDTYGGLGARASSLISTEATTAQLTTWQTDTQTADDRVQSMYSAVGNIIDQLSSFRSTLSAAKSSDGSTDLNSTGSALMKDLADLMNLQQDGRYLFAGGNTRTAPVDTSTLAAATVPYTADTSYYTGNSDQASVRISAQQTITYGVSANSTAFEQALRAANVAANMTTSPMDQNAVNEAYNLATKAMDGLIATQSALSTTSKRLEAAKTRQTNALSLLDTMASDIKSADVAQVSVKLSQYDTQLQAAYSALAKVDSLSLVKYL
ncbi:MAG TPA: flagellin [Magnetospirillum sp.]|jgi:flagellar hook-associated protein 3 FlgL|nr:flagellin [Magnetospirillum sp.]